MMARCRGGDEKRENRNGTEGEEREKVQEVMQKIEHMRRNEREGEKGTGRNMERRRAGRWMKEKWKRERKNREREARGRIINCYFYVYVCNQESESPEGKIKHFVVVVVIFIYTK
jgi:hypothetical protein